MRLPPLIFLFALPGCVDPMSADGPVARQVDCTYFACNVDRVLTRRCSMLACHGRADHAFRVYAPGKLRLAAYASLAERSGPTTPDEVKANFFSARGMTFGAQTPDEVLLVRKTIAPALGGGEHMGGVIFRDEKDPDLAVLRAWAGGAKMPGGCDLLTRIGGTPCAGL